MKKKTILTSYMHIVSDVGYIQHWLNVLLEQALSLLSASIGVDKNQEPPGL